jgi:amino acid adenylation domain-containing protein
VFDATGTAGVASSEDTVLSVCATRRDAMLVLESTYRTDVLDADSAARLAGYHLTALAQLVEDPDAEHRRRSLLSEDELRLQLDGLAGPHRELPDRRFHELFEERVRLHPDAVAAVHGDRRWTYRELNGRANRIARALVARDLGREDVVAVVTERNLDWMASVIAVLKAGGVYLPVEPHFPGDRIARTLDRAGCRLVLTESGSTATLDHALTSLPEARTLYVDQACAEGRSEEDLGVAVTADQLAYIYFTSGSTGEPKGAMCEHAGMLNHLFAKVDDLDIGEADVVAQTAPQCFDISLWQLVSALLVGGRTLIVEQEAILDVERFVDTLADGAVCVAQVVPSYLEVVLSYLEQRSRALPPSLRVVSVTGEAVKQELVQRWFATEPDIKLVNAYGLTETSDDTNHEVLDRAPVGDVVPLGRPVNNVRVHVVDDEHLSPVPLGAPGLIVFSGVCVGRGYVNDPERTGQAYLEDPHRPGERLYRGGDYGRWQPDGKLVFLGRKDSQVKIAGFRIEIGEIENTLLRVPGVRDGAVVVAERPDRGKQLVAFYGGPHPLDVELLRERLGASLPAYMVPAAFHWQETLPLTANGKIDRSTLSKRAAEPEDAGTAHQTPTTPSERRLAAAWAKVLGVAEDTIGRRDHFFDLGGSSLSAVKLAITMQRAVTLKDVTRHPVLADLAEVLDGRTGKRDGLLQLLTVAPDASRTLLCFPYAGGNAVNFQPMAAALRGTGIAVYAVELPGHDVSTRSEPLASITAVVEQVVDEVVRRGLTGVMVWGHSSGTAPAVATARRLEERGVRVEHVFLAAQLLGDPTRRRAGIADLTERSTTEILAMLGDGGYSELGQLDAQRADLVGACYRHDAVSAHRYFVEARERPPAARLSAPVTAVCAADDPSTVGYLQDHEDWSLLAEHVELHELATGGHYFLRTCPTEAADAVLHATDLVVSR